jgi:hypothetical protein
VESLVQLYISLLRLLPFESSNAGYAFKRLSNTKTKASSGVNKKIRRYYGFDPGYEPIRRHMMHSVFSAHWLNAINDNLVERLGGYQKISADVPSSWITKIENGVVLRGSHLPPIGDINKEASDIGSIPEIARLLKPLRAQITAFGDPGMDAQEWLCRYDDMENRPWEGVGL